MHVGRRRVAMKQQGHTGSVASTLAIPAGPWNKAVAATAGADAAQRSPDALAVAKILPLAPRIQKLKMAERAQLLILHALHPKCLHRRMHLRGKAGGEGRRCSGCMQGERSNHATYIQGLERTTWPHAPSRRSAGAAAAAPAGRQSPGAPLGCRPPAAHSAAAGCGSEACPASQTSGRPAAGRGASCSAPLGSCWDPLGRPTGAAAARPRCPRC